MKTPIKFLLLFVISIALFNCNSNNNNPIEEEEEEDNAIPQVNTVVSTFVGDANAAPGYENGQGTNATFNFLWNITFDNSGNMFAADSGNHVIRKITPNGVVTTFSGTSAGFIDGSMSQARFYEPKGLVFDSQGNLFVADSRNHAIRKITPAGVVSTITGSGDRGYVDGNVNQAEFSDPSGLEIDAQDNIYVADTGNHVIRKITPAGNVTTYAGSGQSGFENGSGNVATFKSPSDLVFDSQGNLFIADGGVQLIRKIDTNQEVTSFAGPGVNGFEWFFYLNGCFGIDIDASDNLYIAIAHGSKVVKITPEGKILNFAGDQSEGVLPGHLDGTGAVAIFQRPSGVAINSSGAVFISDYGNNDIRKIVAQ